jgi:DNA invertase Pin-like site-specific DNA recombinase
VESLKAAGVDFVSAPAGARHLETIGRAVFQMLGVFAEFEAALV